MLSSADWRITMSALPKPALSRMTVEEFLDWPGDGTGRTHQLIDGEPQAMAPASITHGHHPGHPCRDPREPSDRQRLSCRDRARRGSAGPIRSQYAGPRSRRHLRGRRDRETCGGRADPSRRNTVAEQRAETRANVWTYTTIPTVREILLVRSTHIAAELIRREPDGGWPANALPIAADSAAGSGEPRFLVPASGGLRGYALSRLRLISAAAASGRGRARRTDARGNAAPPGGRRGRYWR